MTISALFLLLLVIFMVFNPGVYTASKSEAPSVLITRLQKDVTEPDVSTIPTESVKPVPGQTGNSDSNMLDVMMFSVVSIEDEHTLENILLTLKTLNCAYTVVDSLSKFFAGDIELPQTLIIDSVDIDNTMAEKLQDFIYDGGNVIFTELPVLEEGESSILPELLGIIEFQTDYEIEGVDIYEGLLVGGMFSSQKLSFDCVRVILDGNCRVFATGVNPNRDMNAPYIERGDKNPLVWRRHYGEGRVFVINAPFMERDTGLGILTGLIAMTHEAILYPIVGARAIILNNFPYIADHFQTVDGRSVASFMRDIMMPDLISMATRLDITYTCYPSGNFAKASDSKETFEFFENQIRKAVGGEMGFAVNSNRGIYEADKALLTAYGKFEGIRSYIAGELPPDIEADSLNPEITSLMRYDGGLETIGWVSDRTVSLPLLSGDIGDDADALDFVGALSLMGIMLYSADMSIPIVDPVKAWNNYSTELATYISYINEKAEFLPSMTISAAAEYVKNYLNTYCTVEYRDNGLSATVGGNSGEVMFILRTYKTIASQSNCTVEEIEDGIYIVRSDSPFFEIELELPE